MSLKIVHIFVISTSIILAVFFGFWAVSDYSHFKNSGNLYLGILSFAVAVALIIYLAWFCRKVKEG